MLPWNIWMKVVGSCTKRQLTMTERCTAGTKEKNSLLTLRVHLHTAHHCACRPLLTHLHPLTCDNMKLYSRSKLVHDFKHVLDVFGGFLPHVVGLLATHVCTRSHWDGVDRGQWAGEERHVNTEPPPLLSGNPILMSRLPHHHNHKAHSWIIWGSREEAGCDASAALLRLSGLGRRICLAHKRLAL